MRKQAAAEKDSSTGVTVSTVPWRVVSVVPCDGFRLSVEFADGTRGEVHLQQALQAEAIGVLEPLRDPEFFNRVFVEAGAVTWPGNIDLAPDAMYDAIRQSGSFEA